MNQNEIIELIKVFDKSKIAKLKIKNEHFSIELDKNSEFVTSVTSAPTIEKSSVAPQKIEESREIKEISKNELTINSPMVGTFYQAPSPSAPPFVKIGDVVKKGKTIAIIEAMKVMNELEAEFECKILDILVEDGQPVQFDMPLFAVEKI